MPLPSTDAPVESSDAPPVASRRRFLGLGASVLGAVATGAAATSVVSATTAAAQPPRGGRTSPIPGGTPNGTNIAATWPDPLLRLVRRITMGLEPSEVALARQLGYAGYLDYHLNAATINDSAIEATVTARLPLLSLPLAEMRRADSNEVEMQLSDAAWYRGAYAKAQLRERMVEFWTDHFNISANKVGYLKVFDDRDVIRPNALGNFQTLLKATAHSGAMLRYLDQHTSRTPTPNQNYAREIMELHTLGVSGGYSQTDVAELSRILTGWSTTADGAFLFIRSYHDRNAKTFLGRAFPAMANTATDAALKSEGDLAIQMLLDHPSTAQFVAWKMARFFLSYTPSQSVVDSVAAVYTKTGGDIKSMMRALLSSKNLMAAPAKYKRPLHLALSGLRGLGTDTALVPNIRQVRTRSDQMGMPVFNWEQPDGFPDSIEWWSGLVVTRWSYVQALSALNNATTARVDSLLFRTPDTADGVVAQIGARLFGGEMSTTLRARLLAYLRAGTYNDTRVRETLSLALSANEYQWY